MTDLVDYLAQVTGQSPSMGTLDPADAGRVPLFLRSLYDLLETRLFDRRFVLAKEHDEPEHATPAEYARHVAQLREALGTNAALVLSHVPAFVRNRLVQAGVPFIVPGYQTFLPLLIVDLRERGARPHRDRQSLSAAAQLVLLVHLQKHTIEGRSLRELADALGYSAMTLTNVGAELRAAGLAEVVPHGRTRRLVFTVQGHELWQRALPLLESPVRARRWVRWTGNGHEEGVPAGVTALARRSNLNDDPIPTFALEQRDYKARVGEGALEECPVRDDAMATIELWAYEPRKVEDDGAVDRLSLFLALRESTDERVQQALATMLEGVSW
jgi:DNA-binding MarR family transcriptional regulator